MKRIRICTPYVDATSGLRPEGGPEAGGGRYWRVEITVDDDIDPKSHPDVLEVINAAKELIATEYGIGAIEMTTSKVL